METSDLWLIALVVVVPALLLWLIFLTRSGRPGKPRLILGIPRAMRPGQPDEVLEGPRLERVMVGGLAATVALALFVPLYWLPEPDRQEAFQEHQDELAVENGEVIFSQPPEALEEGVSIPPEEFKEHSKGEALSQGCARCHGPAQAEDVEDIASGGFAPWQDPVTGTDVSYKAPPLNNVFTRWDEEVIEFTIRRGRPGTPMPAWGVEYGGGMTDQMVENVMAWLKTLPGNNRAPQLPKGCQDPEPDDLECGEEIFAARCEVCHGAAASGREDDALEGSIPDPADPDEVIPAPIWYQGMALWKGDVRHLERQQHMFTVVNGRRFAFMPAFGEAPPQGTPIPPYPLTDAQISAVVAYERTL